MGSAAPVDAGPARRPRSRRTSQRIEVVAQDRAYEAHELHLRGLDWASIAKRTGYLDGWIAAASTGELVVEVLGTPAPAGSRETIRRTGFTTLSAPSTVVIDFYLIRPASAPKRRTVPDRRPGLDKLVRATLDALTTAGAIEDDARVVELVARKHYAQSSSGAHIVVRRL